MRACFCAEEFRVHRWQSIDVSTLEGGSGEGSALPAARRSLSAIRATIIYSTQFGTHMSTRPASPPPMLRRKQSAELSERCVEPLTVMNINVLPPP